MSKTGDSEPTQVDFDSARGGGYVMVVDAAEVVGALRAKHVFERDEYGVDVITVRPPFTGECRASHRFSRHTERWPDDMEPKPIDIAPSVFVDASCDATFPTWEGVRQRLRNEGVAVTAGNEQQMYDTMKTQWESEIRQSLCDEVGVSRGGMPLSIPVQYE